MALIGIDVGTQSLKAVVVDDALAVVGEGRVGYPIAYPRPGHAEQDPGRWLAALGPAIAAALAEAGVAPTSVEALAVTGQLDGCVAVDRAGAALGPCLPWMDRRAAGSLPPLDEAAFRRTTGITPDGGHLAAKARYLAARGVAAARFHQPVSFLVEQLTGRAVYDPALASTTMLYDLATGDHDDDLLAAFGLARAQLPAIAAAAEPAGPLSADGARLTGLPAGVAVAVGTGDDFATPLGAGLVAPGRAICVLGTAEVVGALSAAPAIDARGLVECHPYPAGGFFVENPGWLAGGALAWLGGVLAGGGEPLAGDALDRLAADVAPGADGLAFLPTLSGAMAPEWHAGARGAFYGLTPSHGAGHLARAVLEACAHAMRDVLARLAELAIAAERVVLVGGGANSALWATIRADAAARPVEIAARLDAAPLGAALCAAVCAGRYPSLAAAAAALPPPGAVVAPDPARRAAYDRGHARYRRLFDALRPLFDADARG